MTATKRTPTSAIKLYHRDTPANRRIYDIVYAEMIQRTSLSTWEKRVVYGQPDADAEEVISSWTQRDITGGIGIQDANEGTDTSRIEFGLIDGRSPGQIVPPPKTLITTKPSWASGSAMPLGDVCTDSDGTDPRFYAAWGSHASGWIESTLSWSTTDNDLGDTPTDVGVEFCGWVFIPTDGPGKAIRQSNHATQTLTILDLPFDVRQFGLWSNRLWAISTTNRLYQLTAYDCDSYSDPGNPTIETLSVSDAVQGWRQEIDTITGDVVLDRGNRPTELFTFFNADRKEVLWTVGNKGAAMYDMGGAGWINAPVKPSNHPEYGSAAIVWRDFENLHIAAGGMDISAFTLGNVDAPLSGPSRDQGVPAEYNGSIVDLEGERSTMYALIKGLPPISSSSMMGMESPGSGSSDLAIPAVPMWLAANSGTGWWNFYEDRETSGTPTKMKLSVISGASRLWFGGTDGVMRSQSIPTAFYNPRAKILLGRDPFATYAWFDTIQYDANMIGWDKIASHMFAMLKYATSDAYVDIEYRTDVYEYDPDGALIEPSYIPWKRIDRAGRTLLWFDDADLNPDTGLPWREGQRFQWIQFRFKFYTGNEYRVPILSSFSLHHIRVPQDASSYVIKMPLYADVGGRGSRHRSGLEMIQTLRAMQRSGVMLTLQPNDSEVIRGRIVGLYEEAYPAGGQSFSKVVIINFVEIGASSNTGQVVA